METSSKRPRRGAAALSSARLLNTDSPLTKQGCDIQTFLSVCLLNWAEYSEEEKQVIISTLPVAYKKHEVDEDAHIACPISPEFVGSDRVVRDQIARFKRDVGDGYYTKTWQDKARRAMEERRDGKFDEYLVKYADELFVDVEDEEHHEGRAQSSDGEYGSKQKGRRRKGGGKSKQKTMKKMSRASSTIEDVIDAEFGDG